MKLNECTYPHPVMHAQSQDVEYSFDFNISVAPRATEYSIYYTLNTENQTLLNLIREHKAAPLIHIESSGGFFRAIYDTALSVEKNEIRISAEHLSGRVEVRSFICARSEIPDYKNDKQHEDYEESCFHVQEGDYLAIGPAHAFIADKDYDPLKKLSSFIKIAKGPGGIDQPAGIEYAGPKVKILLPKKLYQKYWELKDLPGHSTTISSLIILPALVFLIAEMRVADCEFSGHIWFLGIQDRFQKMGINLQNTLYNNFELAQLLLDLPIKRVADEIKGQLN